VPGSSCYDFLYSQSTQSSNPTFKQQTTNVKSSRSAQFKSIELPNALPLHHLSQFVIWVQETVRRKVHWHYTSVLHHPADRQPHTFELRACVRKGQLLKRAQIVCTSRTRTFTILGTVGLHQVTQTYRSTYTVTRTRAGRSRVRTLARARNFSVLLIAQTSSGAHRAPWIFPVE
jgi:hypothetical protein